MKWCLPRSGVQTPALLLLFFRFLQNSARNKLRYLSDVSYHLGWIQHKNLFALNPQELVHIRITPI